MNQSFKGCNWLFVTDVTLSCAHAPQLFMNSGSKLEFTEKADDQCHGVKTSWYRPRACDKRSICLKIMIKICAIMHSRFKENFKFKNTSFTWYMVSLFCPVVLLIETDGSRENSYLHLFIF